MEYDSKSIEVNRMDFHFAHLRKFMAFTLSEVLITLVVIGVIAAITIPTMVANWQKQSTVAGLKKAYSTLSNAFERSVVDNGGDYNWDLEGKDQHTIFREIFLPYLNVAIDCKDNSTQQNACEYNFKRYRSSSQLSNISSALVLADGTIVSADYGAFGQNPQDPSDVSFLFFKILVDINGHKKPNVLGRDIFYVYISGVDSGSIQMTVKDIFSWPQAENREDKIKYCKYDGATCAQLIMEDGWQIKKDYPW